MEAGVDDDTDGPPGPRSGPPPSDRRRFERVRVHLPVEFNVDGSGAFGAGVARDVTVKGMFLETDRAASPGTAVLVRVPVAGRKGSVNLLATVRWASHRGLGLEFGFLGPRETYALEQAAKPGGRSPRE